MWYSPSVKGERNAIYCYSIRSSRNSNRQIIGVTYKLERTIQLPEYVVPSRIRNTWDYLNIGCGTCNNGIGAIYTYKTWGTSNDFEHKIDGPCDTRGFGNDFAY